MWISRDKNGKIFLHKERPVKKNGLYGWWYCWWSLSSILELCEEELPKGINPQWKDSEPVEVELRSKKQTPENLIRWSERMQGARAMLMRLIDNGMLLEAGWKGAPIYTKAQTDLILENLDNTNKFLLGDEILYYDHRRNKSGKLISVKARFNK